MTPRAFRISVLRCPQLFLNLLMDNMKILGLFVIIQTVLVQSEFGTSYLGNSRLCHQWSCINTKLGLSDSLPTAEHFENVLRRLLPPDWQGVVDNVLHTCYHDRPRRYSNTCPGQAIMHCAVDQLIANCPEANQRKDDACAPVNSLAGFKHMFTQSRYENIERNIAVERRPAWFLKNYFNSKCCNLPPLFNSTVWVAECGFTSVIQYYIHNPTIQNPGVLPSQMRLTPTTPSNNGDALKIVSLSDVQAENTQRPLPPTTPPSNNGGVLNVVSLSVVLAENTQTPTDPLDCCDITNFIQPSWRQECNFEVSWEGQSRLVVNDRAPASTTTAPVTTSTSKPATRTDVTIVPQSCEQETCVFNKLNILLPWGAVDIDAFTRLLDNFTTSQPSWNSAKGRVVTTCLRRPFTDYKAQCEINRVLACTFDVLTENCPYATRTDFCKHSLTQRTCQISSSKYRPKHRREICILPEIVDRKILSECGLTSLGKMEPVTTITKSKNDTVRLSTTINKCQDLTPSTTCLMSKMGTLNKYGFIDYFKMKDRIRRLTYNNNEWSTMQSVFMNALSYGPMYKEHCNSAKMLLNVVDSMLSMCPESKKKDTAQCTNIFNQLKNAPANTSQKYSRQMLSHFYHIFNPSFHTPKAVRPTHIRKIKTTPSYNYWVLNDKNAPKVTTIDLKPKIKKLPLVEKPPLVLLPVYMTVPHSNLMIRPFSENGVMRSPFSLHNQIAQAHTSTVSPINSWPVSTTSPVFTTSPVSTTPLVSTMLPVSTTPIVSTATPPVSTSEPVSTYRPISTKYTVSPKDYDKFEMLKPE